MMFETKMLSMKDQVMSSASISEEETATMTTRSASDSYNESSIETPRSTSKSGDAEYLDDNSYQEDEYYAFLRELAGSYVEEADTGSEGGSEDEAGTEDEDEECEPSCRKLAPEPSSGVPVKADSGWTSPRLSPACGQASHGGGGRGSSGPVGKVKQGKDSESWSSRRVSSGWQPTEEAGRRRPPAICAGTGTPQSPISAGGEGGNVVNPPFGNGKCGVPTPSHDYRSLVEDDYDVVQAVQDFAARRPGSRHQQQREDLQEAIRQKVAQARGLEGVASSPHVGLYLREHYSRVRNELLDEAQQLEADLAALGEEDSSAEDDRNELTNPTNQASGTLRASPLTTPAAALPVVPLVPLPARKCAGDVKAAPSPGFRGGEVCQVACG